MKDGIKIAIISLFISLVSIAVYHTFLLKKEYITTERLKGVYTIDLTTEIQRIVKEAREAINAGDTIDLRKRMMVLHQQVEILAKKLPDGYLLLPEEVIIGGKRKIISLSTGKVEESKKVGRAINLDLLNIKKNK